MIKVVTTMRRKAGLSHEEFRHHYEHTHRQLASYFTTYIDDYRRTYPARLSRSGDLLPNDESDPTYFDCLTEFWVRDHDSLAKVFAVLNDPEIRPIVVADSELFMDVASVRMRVCEEYDICEDLGKFSNSFVQP